MQTRFRQITFCQNIKLIQTVTRPLHVLILLQCYLIRTKYKILGQLRLEILVFVDTVYVEYIRWLLELSYMKGLKLYFILH